MRGSAPGIFLSQTFDRGQYHQLGYFMAVSASLDPGDLQTPFPEYAGVHPVPRLPDRTLSLTLSISKHVHTEHAPLHLTSHG